MILGHYNYKVTMNIINQLDKLIYRGKNKAEEL